MNYITEINAFYDSLETNPLSSPDIVLWFALMSIANKTGWQKEFTVAISTLKAKTGLPNNKAVERARNKLEQLGYISWHKRSGNQAAIYIINSLCDKTPPKNVAQPVAQPVAQYVSQSVSQPVAINKLNKTKLNKTKDLKDIYGEFANVLLTAEELDKLKIKFPLDYLERIERVSEYVEQTGRKYDSHYATILSWSRKDKEQPQTARGKPNKPTFFEMLDNIVGDESEAIDI